MIILSHYIEAFVQLFMDNTVQVLDKIGLKKDPTNPSWIFFNW